MTAKKVSETSRNTVEDIADKVMHSIQMGRYVPGQRLIEADLMEEFNVKRGPVREALRILSGDGIVELVPMKGARVRKLDQRDIVDLFPVLSSLLTTTIRLAIDKVGKAPFRQKLETAMESLRQARQLEDYQQFQLASIRYSDVLHEAADNRYISFLNAKLHPELFFRQLSGTIQIEDWDSHLDHFENVHQALMSADDQEAVRLLEEFEARMVSMFSREDEPVVWK